MTISQPLPQKVTVSPITRVLGQLPSGLLALTTRRVPHETGILLSWAMQAGFAPPAVTVAIRQDRYVTAWLSEGATYVLNLLEHGQYRIVRHFARGFAIGQNAFAGVSIDRTTAGNVILREALGYIECKSRDYVDSCDHRVFLGDVIGGSLMTKGDPPVHIRGTGMHY